MLYIIVLFAVFGIQLYFGMQKKKVHDRVDRFVEIYKQVKLVPMSTFNAFMYGGALVSKGRLSSLTGLIGRSDLEVDYKKVRKNNTLMGVGFFVGIVAIVIVAIVGIVITATTITSPDEQTGQSIIIAVLVFTAVLLAMFIALIVFANKNTKKLLMIEQEIYMEVFALCLGKEYAMTLPLTTKMYGYGQKGVQLDAALQKIAMDTGMKF